MDEDNNKPKNDASDRSGNASTNAQSLKAIAERFQTQLAPSSAITDLYNQIQVSGMGLGKTGSIVEQFQHMRSSIGASDQLRKMLEPDPAIKAALKQQNSLSTVGALGSHFNAATSLANRLEPYKNLGLHHESFFSLPAHSRIGEIFERLQLAPTSLTAYARLQLDATTAQRNVMLSLTQPWLRESSAMRSAAALLELQGIGSALQSIPNFDLQLTTALRANLGDWRDPITFEPDIADDPEKRTALYVEHGFNTALTDFPEKTFEESLILVGLGTDVDLRLNELYALGPGDEAALQRTNQCHNHLQKLERALRQFIHNAMTAHYGADWVDKKLPPEIREAWERKRSQLEKQGTILTLFIEVSDFTDYERIICRKDFWREVFEARFGRKESVVESFQRLYPIRLATMHGRFVTQDDLLYLMVESIRLMSAIRDE